MLSYDSHAGARYLDRLVVDDVDEAKGQNSDLVHAAPEVNARPSQQSQRPTSSRPQTGQFSLDLNAKASSRAAILVAAADKFYLLSAFAGLIE